MARWVLVVAGALCLFFAGYYVLVEGGPLLSHPGHGVRLVNRSALTVLVHEGATTDRPYDARLGPGETRANQWLVPAGVSAKAAWRRRVQAWDEGGGAVFCRDYTYGELDRLGWQIEITPGVLDCP